MLFHVLNRGVGRMELFSKENDYAAFERSWNRPGSRGRCQRRIASCPTTILVQRVSSGRMISNRTIPSEGLFYPAEWHRAVRVWSRGYYGVRVERQWIRHPARTGSTAVGTSKEVWDYAARRTLTIGRCLLYWSSESRVDEYQ